MICMNELPEKYKAKMQDLLQDEYDAYIESFSQKHHTSLRVNESKISVEQFLKTFPYPLTPVPWCHNGFYFSENDPITKHPYYYAGLYYIQEASAMLPAEVMPIEENDRVLDICAAPGGKSSELGVKLKDTGVLVSNDISYSRCQALLKNLEKFGIRNAYVTSTTPQQLNQYFPCYFDKILIDAPCSGEGMFRKDKTLITSYIERDSSYYVPIQKSIIEQAIQMLKPGGNIVYSTCTFSKEEDEEIIQYALSLDPSLHIVPIRQYDGFIQNAYGTKLFPHRVKGEGHFVSLLQKDGEKIQNPVHETCVFDTDTIHMQFPSSQKIMIKDSMYACKDLCVDTTSLRIMRSGVKLYETKKKRIELSEYLPMYFKKNEYTNCIHLSQDDIRVKKYLKGETIDVKDFMYEDGVVVICVDAYPLGLASIKNGIFKNKYPKSWRMK